MDLLQTLEGLGLGLRRQLKPGEYVGVCPRCQKRKLAINIDKKVWQCWYCGQGGGMGELGKWLNAKISCTEVTNFRNLRSKFLDAKPLNISKICDANSILPCEFIPLTGSSHVSIMGQKALNYVKGRGLTEGEIEQWGLGYCTTGKYRNMIVIPVEDTDGVVRSFQTRRFFGDGSKNLNPFDVDKIVFNLRHAYGKPGIIIVEGPWDAFGVHKQLAETYNISGVALLGHTCSAIQARQIAQFLKPEYVWIALDPDVTEEERDNVGNVLLAEGLQNVEILHPSKDPDEILADEFVILFKEAKKAIRRRIN